jgi:hypothetical protein
MLGVGGVGLFCGRVHLQTRETKENPRKTKENPFNQQKKYLPINGSIFNQ